jgi:hypothetical protein
VPAHVRNDNHGVAADNGVFEALVMWTENFGATQCTNNPQWFARPSHHGWSWWQNTAGFQKLEDFWNRDLLRTKHDIALNADASDDNRTLLGLSEFSNGNFISEDASYGDFFADQKNVKHWFQFPQLRDTTQPNLKRLRWGAGQLEVRTNTIALRNDLSGIVPYLSKTKSGISVKNHSALRYEAVRNPGKMNTFLPRDDGGDHSRI